MEEYEKSHPLRPKLNSLNTAEEIQKWLPSIKQDMDFYLKKSQVTCYSDEHIEECKQKVVSLEKEFKAFVRKIKQLTPGTLDAIPWTNRPYKRKHTDSVVQPSAIKEFKPIATPILNQEVMPEKEAGILIVDMPRMDQPLTFNFDSDRKLIIVQPEQVCPLDSVSNSENNLDNVSCSQQMVSKTVDTDCSKVPAICSINKTSLVNYNYSSDSDG